MSPVVVNLVGQRIFEGRAQLLSVLEQLRSTKVAELVVDKVLSHSKADSVNGTLTLSSRQRYAFCNVYEFSSAKGERVKAVDAYAICLEAVRL